MKVNYITNRFNLNRMADFHLFRNVYHPFQTVEAIPEGLYEELPRLEQIGSEL